MADYRLRPRTAFGAETPRAITHGAASLTERPDLAIASVAARAGQGAHVASVIEARLGAACPVSAFVEGPELSAFWTGPDQWFVIGDHVRHERLAETLEADLGALASVTEQNDGWVVFDLTGEALGRLLERLCNIDLSAFHAGRAQRTVIEHVPSYVLCRETERSYRLLCARSYALSFAHGLELAMETAASLTERKPCKTSSAISRR